MKKRIEIPVPELAGPILRCWYDRKRCDWQQRIEEARQMFPDYKGTLVALP
jgi:hypothetical protein